MNKVHLRIELRSKRFFYISNYLKNNNLNGNIIDIGCKNGFLKRYLDDKNNYFGCDINPISNNDFIDIEDNNFNAYTYLLNKNPDIIILSEVLEHLGNFEQAIINISRMKNINLIITVPNPFRFWNMVSIYKSNWKENINKDFNNHIHSFTEKTLINLLVKYNFKIIFHDRIIKYPNFTIFSEQYIFIHGRN